MRMICCLASKTFASLAPGQYCHPGAIEATLKSMGEEYTLHGTNSLHIAVVWQQQNKEQWNDNRRLRTCKNLSSFLTSWPSYLIFDLEKLWPVSDYICGPILITIGQELWLVSSWTQYIMEYRGLTSSSPCDAISDVFIKKYIFPS